MFLCIYVHMYIMYNYMLKSVPLNWLKNKYLYRLSIPKTLRNIDTNPNFSQVHMTWYNL